jgi:hypothetical protein
MPMRKRVLDDLDNWLRERFRRQHGIANMARQELAARKGIIAISGVVKRAVKRYRSELMAEAYATVTSETSRGRRRTSRIGQEGCGREPVGARPRRSCLSRRLTMQAVYTALTASEQGP